MGATKCLDPAKHAPPTPNLQSTARCQVTRKNLQTESKDTGYENHILFPGQRWAKVHLREQAKRSVRNGGLGRMNAKE